jgi:uncharacterized protein (TIGR02186 family)
MKLKAALLALAACVAAAHAHAQGRGAPQPCQLAAAVADEAISVDSTFRGARITVFGACPGAAAEIAVRVRGPGGPVTVMRKRRTFGLWLNADPVQFVDAPTFFALVTARPITQFADPREIWSLGLDPRAIARLASATPADADPAAYRMALLRLKREAGLYQDRWRDLVLHEGGLFQADIAVPANAPPGAYTVDVYLFRNGRLSQSQSGGVVFNRAGIERRIHDLARSRPLFYGLLTVAFALIAGWAAAWAFRRT